MVPTVLCCFSERAMRSIEGSSAWSPECTTEAICFEHPKSASFTSPSWSTRTFDPFMSRWTMPFVCRYSSPASICLEYLSIIRTKKPHRSRENMQAFVPTYRRRPTGRSIATASAIGLHTRRTHSCAITSGSQARTAGRTARARSAPSRQTRTPGICTVARLWFACRSTCRAHRCGVDGRRSWAQTGAPNDVWVTKLFEQPDLLLELHERLIRFVAVVVSRDLTGNGRQRWRGRLEAALIITSQKWVRHEHHGTGLHGMAWHRAVRR